MKDIALHARLIEQAAGEDLPAVHIQEVEQSNSSNEGSVFKLTFACNSPLSWQAMSGSLDSPSLSCQKIKIFEPNFGSGHYHCSTRAFSLVQIPCRKCAEISREKKKEQHRWCEAPVWALRLPRGELEEL